MFKEGNWVKGVPAAAGAVAALVLVGALLWIEPNELSWAKAIGLLFIAGFVFALVATMRFALGGLAEPPPPPAGADGQAVIRSRLAPLVFITGTVGIVVLAIAVILAVMETDRQAGAETYLGIFSTVVPVLATWVGSVIAFYFSNESFRQAAAAAAGKGDPTDLEPVTAPHRMIPADKITGLVAGEKPDEASDPLPDIPDRIPLAAARKKLSETVSRVIVFSKPNFPALILRDKLMGGLKEESTVADYRALEKNGADALNFRFIPETATVGDARALLRTYGTVDLFVTATGSPSEPIKGWLTDSQLS